MSQNLIYVIGSKACTWSGVVAAHFWPQSPCNPDETWNIGMVIVGALLLLAAVSVYRHFHAWHRFYGR